jgi:hypothetical protein
MANDMNHWMGGPRHAPRPEFGNAEYFGDDAKPVARISVSETDPKGTGALLSGPKKPRKGSPQGVASLAGIESPLDTSAHDDIVSASGLGQPASKPGIGEKDEGQADEDERFNRDTVRPATTGNPGNPSNPHPLLGRIRESLRAGRESSPLPNRTLADYPNLNYEPMPANLAELQTRIGTTNWQI